MDSGPADFKIRYSKADVATLIDRRFKDIQAVREAGQKEYAHDDTRPFRNFEALTEDFNGEVPREKIAWILFKKHMDGILAYINGHRSQRESVSGRFKDAHMYLFLIEFMLQEDEENGK